MACYAMKPLPCEVLAQVLDVGLDWIPQVLVKVLQLELREREARVYLCPTCDGRDVTAFFSELNHTFKPASH